MAVKTTLYQRTKLNKVQQWSIWAINEGESGFPEVHISFGYTDGKQQTTFDVIKEGVNIGKSNETTAVQQAQLEMERKITKQKEEGYVEDIDDTNKSTNMDWDKPFPKEMCFYKPKSSIEDDKLTKLENKGKAIYSVKRDGLMNIIRSSDLGIEIYSRRMDNVSDKFPHLISAFKSLPKKTILLGEVIFDKAGKDDFKTCCSICRSDADEAIRKQEELGKVKYYAFDIAFHEGKNLLTTITFKARREIMLRLIKKINSEYVVASEVIEKNHYDALEEVATKRGLEGLVIWDADGIMAENEAFSMAGKPRRPNMLWKLKKKMETDVIVKWAPNDIGDYGNGKLKGLFGNGFMYQLHDGKEVFLGKIGGGLSEKQREFYTDTKLFPRCWCIEFDSPQSSGKLRFPVFKLDRTTAGDKDIDECELDDRIFVAMEDDEE